MYSSLLSSSSRAFSWETGSGCPYAASTSVSRRRRSEVTVGVSQSELTLIFTSLGASFFTSVSNRSPKPEWGQYRVTRRCEQEVLRTAVHALTFDERGAATQYDGGEERAPQVHVGLLDGVGQDFVDAWALVSDQVGSEQQLRGAEPGGADLKTARSHVRGMGRNATQERPISRNRTYI